MLAIWVARWFQKQIADSFVYLFLQVKKAKMQESGEQTLRYVKFNIFLMTYL